MRSDGEDAPRERPSWLLYLSVAGPIVAVLVIGIIVLHLHGRRGRASRKP